MKCEQKISIARDVQGEVQARWLGYRRGVVRRADTRRSALRCVAERIAPALILKEK